jgi:hypothetical protein
LHSEGDLVRIPYCLPDDESLIERLNWKSPAEVNEIWPWMFEQTHRNGELFTLGLHPERTVECLAGLKATLKAVRNVNQEVWCTSLGEVAEWWKARQSTKLKVVPLDDDFLQLDVVGPPGTTLLTRSVDVKTRTEPWFDGYRRVVDLPCTVQVNKRPFLGASPDLSAELKSFLQQQGYIIETATGLDTHTGYLDWHDLCNKNLRRIIEQIEESDAPLVRFGRWPNGAHSAFNVTGDIDALTLWDYGLRAFAR